MTINKLKKELRKYASTKRAEIDKRFFKIGKGQYSEHDRFLGITSPNIRLVAKEFADIDLNDMKQMP